METLVRHAQEGTATWSLDSLIITKVASVETGSAYSLQEQVVTPASNPPMHVHVAEEEAFYVLDGEIELEVDGTVAVARTGSFALVPRGVAHTYRVLTETARVLVLTSSAGAAPGGGFEGFVAALGRPAEALVPPPPSQPDLERLATAAAAAGIELLAPPSR
jgi:quercetin dioxygenase-like cupin family protein